MSKSAFIAIAVVVSGTMFFAPADTAWAAKKKLTYDQAWAKCKVHVDKIAGDQHSQKAAAGASCMKRYGYNI